MHFREYIERGISLAFCAVFLVPRISAATVEIPRVELPDSRVERLLTWLLIQPSSSKQIETSVIGCFDLTSDAGYLKMRPEFGKFTTETFTAGSNEKYLDLSQISIPANPADVPLNRDGPTVYAVTGILCPDETECWIDFRTDGAASLWLNGVPYGESGHSRHLADRISSVRAKLRKGFNTIVVKLVKTGKVWTFSCSVGRGYSTCVDTALDSERVWLMHAVAPINEDRRFALSGLPEGAEFHATVKDVQGLVRGTCLLRQGTLLSTMGLDVGLYVLEIGRRNGSTATRQFTVGTPRDLLLQFDTRFRRLSMSPSLETEISGYMTRLAILANALDESANSDPWDFYAFSSEIDQKTIFATQRLSEIQAELSSGKVVTKARAGLQLKGFVSAIDGQRIYYRLFTPSGYQEKTGVPLVVIMQTVFTRQGPYIGSAFVALHSEAEEWGKIADKYGVAILWPGYHSCPYGSIIDDVHFDEVYSALQQEIKIDTTRVYLYGTCSGGIGASLESLRHPHRYAAISLVNPVLKKLRNRYIDNDLFNGCHSYSDWIELRNPFDKFARSTSIPVTIYHDEVDPGHGPVEHVKEYQKINEASGGHPKVTIARNTGRARESIFDEQLAWLSHHSLAAIQPQVECSNSKEFDSISAALGDGFAVVMGSTGDNNEQRLENLWVARFCDAWQSSFYGPCRVIKDTEVQESDMRDRNLVIIGNSKTNRLWREYASRCQVHVAIDGARIGDRKWYGENLTIQCVVQSPEHPGRKLIFVGAEDLSRARPGTSDLGLDGWFDYAVWGHRDGRNSLIDAGVYQDGRNLFISSEP